MTSPRHVIVCGAGVMGAAVAYYLTRRGVAVTVVERTGVAAAPIGAAGARGAARGSGGVEAVTPRGRAVSGVPVDGQALEADAVVLAMGPWTGHVKGVALPSIHGLKGFSVTLTAADVPAHA